MPADNRVASVLAECDACIREMVMSQAMDLGGASRRTGMWTRAVVLACMCVHHRIRCPPRRRSMICHSDKRSLPLHKFLCISYLRVAPRRCLPLCVVLCRCHLFFVVFNRRGNCCFHLCSVHLFLRHPMEWHLGLPHRPLIGCQQLDSKLASPCCCYVRLCFATVHGL